MTENEPKLDTVSQARIEYDELINKVERPLMSAEEAHALMAGIGPFFELGVKLGEVDSAESEALRSEIKRYIEDRKKQLHDAIFPKWGTNRQQGG